MTRKHFEKRFNVLFQGQIVSSWRGGHFGPPDTLLPSVGQRATLAVEGAVPLYAGEPNEIPDVIADGGKAWPRNSPPRHLTSMPPIPAKPSRLIGMYMSGWKPV